MVKWNCFPHKSDIQNHDAGIPITSNDPFATNQTSGRAIPCHALGSIELVSEVDCKSDVFIADWSRSGCHFLALATNVSMRRRGGREIATTTTTGSHEFRKGDRQFHEVRPA